MFSISIAETESTLALIWNCEQKTSSSTTAWSRESTVIAQGEDVIHHYQLMLVKENLRQLVWEVKLPASDEYDAGAWPAFVFYDAAYRDETIWIFYWYKRGYHLLAQQYQENIWQNMSDLTMERGFDDVKSCAIFFENANVHVRFTLKDDSKENWDLQDGALLKRERK